MGRFTKVKVISKKPQTFQILLINSFNKNHLKQNFESPQDIQENYNKF